MFQMQNLSTASRFCYGLGMALMGCQQIQYAAFRPVFLSPWPVWLANNAITAYLLGAVLLVTGMWIAVSEKAFQPAIVLGILMLALFLFNQAPYLLFIGPHSAKHLGLWINPLKELALSGGAFILAGIFAQRENQSIGVISSTSLIRFGIIFFSITILLFGISHFYYPDFVAMLVPSWIPGKVFWTYFSAIALIGSGAFLLLNIKTKLVALLTGIMLLLWLLILHIPRAIANPSGDAGNEVTSVFQALAFSGIAFAISIVAEKHHLPRR